MEHNREERESKRQVWEQRLAGWEASGMSQAAYCREHELDYSQFMYWKRRLRSSHNNVQLVPVGISSPLLCGHQEAPSLRLIVSERYPVEITPGFDALTLRRLIMVLEQSC